MIAAAEVETLDIAGLEGLQVLRDFISVEEEALLIQQLDERTWAGRGIEPNPEMKRRHQHYGGVFSYRLRRVVGKMEQLPAMFDFVTERLLDRQIYHTCPNSIIVNEYEAGQGIMPHVDAPKLFGPTITALSLLSDCVMTFQHVKDSSLVFRVHLLMAAPFVVPTIDITALLSSTSTTADKQRAAVELLEAFTTYGVFYVTSPSHALFSTATTTKVLDATQRLFALDTAQKSLIPKIQPGGFTRGYVPIGGESGSATKELKEGFSYGYEWPLEDLKAKQASGSLNGLQGPNAWPSQVALGMLDQGHSNAFKNTLEEFYLQVCDVAKGLLKGISLALALPEDELAKYCTTSETISFMRLFHYLPYADQGHTTQIGSSAHTDWGFLTLILSPCKTVGLQLFHNNQWQDVPSKDNTLVINGGDYLSLLTGGKLISPLHRVVSNGQEERYSMCCFYYPDYDAKIPLLVQGEVKGQAASGNYSLLRDQRDEDAKHDQVTDGQDARTVATKLLNGEINFGDYIISKWTQVYRKGGAY
ncbi:hypothetical protein FBU30_003448 [Linnemannia zychae]|nr:hypothetical protein FBU30_003448 [Linnemannia zychae]